MMNKIIEPNLINEYFYCKNKLIIKNLQTSFNKYIAIGNMYDKENLSKIKLGNFEIDEIDFNNKIIIERKKRISNFEGSKFQLLYYLYLTKHIYKNFQGILVGIEDNKKYKFKLNKENEKELEKICNDIIDIINQNSFNKELLIESKCKNCGMYDFCNF